MLSRADLIFTNGIFPWFFFSLFLPHSFCRSGEAVFLTAGQPRLYRAVNLHFCGGFLFFCERPSRVNGCKVRLHVTSQFRSWHSQPVDFCFLLNFGAQCAALKRRKVVYRMKWPVCNVHGFNNLCIFVRRHRLCFLLVLLELTFFPRSLTSYPFSWDT